MSYSPNNINIFLAAFSGAIAGMGASDKVPTDDDPTSAVNVGIVDVAGAFAQSFDTEWASSDATSFEVETAKELCETAWQERSPQPVSPFLTPATYNDLSNALIALIHAADTYLSDQGITPPPLSGAAAARVNSGDDNAQTITNNTNTAMIFSGVDYDTDNMVDLVAHSTRITFKTAGVFRVAATVKFAANVTGARTLFIRKNGATIIAEAVNVNSGAANPVLNALTEYPFAVNDYIEGMVNQNSGGDLDIQSTAEYTKVMTASLVYAT